MASKPQERIQLFLALSLCALLGGGCAGLRCPRIDPTGERFFIYPRDQVPAVTPATGNIPVAPVYTDPVFPQPGTTPPTSPAGPVVPPPPQDRMMITPNRVLAPVGSEVILKSGLCTAENFLLTETKTEWLIARESAGEFVSLGGRGLSRNPLLPWNKPEKIDNQYAVGYSAKVPLTITRGTQDTLDDVQIEPGEAWATITSPVEGTSHITAVAPEVVNWSGRRATATIYWVDTQWTFPPVNLSAGGAQVLTTTVRRQTDGTNLQGWLVRYEVAGSSGTLTGGTSNQIVEVPTDANGQASIDVTPTSGSGSTTQINIQIIRPERFAGSDMPRLVIAKGSSTIHWTETGSPYLPPPDDLGSTPIPSLPPTPSPPPVTQKPELEIEIRGDSQAQVNAQTRLEVVLRNQGNATATGVILYDRYHKGFRHLADLQRRLEIKNDQIGDISPGTSRTLNLSFDVLEAGNLCHDFTLSSREGAQAKRTFCIQAIQPQPQARPGIEVRKNGPNQKEVGQNALFTLTIKNTGDVPLTNLLVIDEYDSALSPQPTQQGYDLINNSIVWKIARLEVGAIKRLDVNCQCLAPKTNACSTVQITADAGASVGAIQSADKKCIEILRRRDMGNVLPPTNVVPPSSDVMPPVQPLATGLQLDLLTLSNNPAQAGSLIKYEIVVANNTAAIEKQVQLRVLFPPGVVPNMATIQNSANLRASLNSNNEVVFEQITDLRPKERLTFDLQATTTQPGVGNVTARLSSQNLPQPIQKEIRIEVTR